MTRHASQFDFRSAAARKCGRLMRWLIVALLAALASGARAQEAVVDWAVTALLADAAGFDSARVAAGIRTRLLPEDKLGAITTSAEGVDITFERGSASIMLKASPWPATEIAEVCKHAAWYWRDACDVVGKHAAHVRVVVRNTQMRKVDSAVLATRLLGAVTSGSGAVATLWGVNLQSAAVFQKAADTLQRERVPATMWISFRYTREASGNVSVITRGMPAFELMEIESRDTPYPARDLLEMVMSTSQRLIMKGAVIGDGETIGGSPGRRVHLRFADSQWTPGRRVYRIEIGG